MAGSFLLLCWLAVAIFQEVLGGGLRSPNTPSQEYPTRLLSRVYKSDSLRNFIGNAILKYPEDITASQTIGFDTFDMVLGDFRCFDLSYGAISIASASISQRDYIQLEITDFVFRCTFGINWSYGLFDGKGSVYVDSHKNHLTTKIPTDIVTSHEEIGQESCEGTMIDIDNLSFSGDMSLRILNLYKRFIERIAEDRLREISCEIMNEEILGLVLYEVREVVANYTDIPEWRRDPLFVESSSIAANKTNGTMIDFQNDRLIGIAMHNLNLVFADKHYDPNATTADNMDYGINTILREKFLEEDGAFLFIAKSDNYELYESTSVVDVNVTVHTLKIYGLDTTKVLSPLAVIGNRTIQNEVAWDRVTIEANATVEVRASPANYSYFENADALQPITENVVFTAGAENISATVSLVMPLDKDVAYRVPKGYILNWRELPACIPPGLFDVALSGLNINLGHILQSTIQGISSNEIDQLAQDGVVIGVESFEAIIIDTFPGMSQTDGRDIINNVLEHYHCPQGVEGDFR